MMYFGARRNYLNFRNYSSLDPDLRLFKDFPTLQNIALFTIWLMSLKNFIRDVASNKEVPNKFIESCGFGPIESTGFA